MQKPWFQFISESCGDSHSCSMAVSIQVFPLTARCCECSGQRWFCCSSCATVWFISSSTLTQSHEVFTLCFNTASAYKNFTAQRAYLYKIPFLWSLFPVLFYWTHFTPFSGEGDLFFFYNDLFRSCCVSHSFFHGIISCTCTLNTCTCYQITELQYQFQINTGFRFSDFISKDRRKFLINHSLSFLA